MAQPLLDVSGLTSHYGPIEALHGVDLAVGQGELVALVGANGAGKSTILRTLSGIQPVTSGTVRYRGEDITTMSSQKRVALGICHVPEGRQVFGPLTVEDNLMLGTFRRRRNPAEDLEKIYETFPILRKKRLEAAGTLSGGQQQMLAIGRALMGNPELLLLDEPSMGLAPLLVGEIFNIVQMLKEQGVTILLVEQNAYAALAIADRGYVLETGEMVLTDSGENLLANEKVKSAYLGI